jgi:hypothetical protein
VKAAAQCGRWFILALCLLALAGETRAGAQQGGAQAGLTRTVRGSVLTPAGDSLRGVPRTWVVLHRVGRDTAGAVDSVRADANGAFLLRAPVKPDDDAIWFLSSSRGGIAYFSPSLPPGDVSGEDGEIIVYDTTSAGIPLQLRGRHIVFSAAGVDGMRDVVEVYEISNDSSRTLISPDERTPTWAVLLPDGATSLQVGEGDVPAEAVRVDSGRVHVVAPFAPGLKQFSIAYRVPASAFPLSVPVRRATESLEVFLEEEGAAVEGAGLASAPPADVQGRHFRRFQAANVPANSVVRITVPRVSTSRRSLYVAGVLIVVMVAMLLALARGFRRRAAPEAPPVAVAAPSLSRSADAIAREIAALDREFEARPDPSARLRADYERSRAELKERLTRALAADKQPV